MKSKFVAKVFLFVSAVIAISATARKSQAAISSQEIPYYGQEFYSDLAAGVSNEALVQRIQSVMRKSHQAVQGSYDQIVESCSGPGCYQHISLGYDTARVFMMGVYYLVKDEQGYALPDVYCGVYKRASEFGDTPPGPRQIPDGKILNTEHTWPQSKFTHKFDTMMQKSDLHHLFPTDSEMNSIRSSNQFGEVVKDSKKLKCSVSRLGSSADGRKNVFEPPAAHKGNVARAIFYFSVHYSLSIGDEEEATLRKWNREDPVDEEEAHRNDEIMKVQGNRNPFIDYPELVDRINHF